METKNFSLRDLYLASTLISLGFEMTGIDYQLEGGEKGEKLVGYFNFDYSDDIVLEMRDGSTVKYMVGKIQTNTSQSKSGIIDEFISSITEARRPLITGVDSHNTIATIVACFKSSELGEWVKVEY